MEVDFGALGVGQVGWDGQAFDCGGVIVGLVAGATAGWVWKGGG